MAQKSDYLIYGVDDKVPILQLILYGLQMASCSAGSLVMPVVIARTAGVSNGVAISLVAVSMIAWALGAIIQAYPKWGSGYLAIPNNSGTYLGPSILAAEKGGLALVAGMTLLGGLCHTLVARILQYIRRWIPPEIGAVVLLLIGIQLGQMGLDEMFKQKSPDPLPGLSPQYIGMLTIAIMLVCTLAFKKTLGRYCVLIGIAVGYLSTLLVGYSGSSLKLSLLASAPWFGFPQLAASGYAFKTSLILPFFIAGLISAVKSTSLLTAAQRGNDVNWTKPDMKNLAKGNVADGIGCMISGALGSMGQNISSSSVGIPIQTGATSRSIGYSFAAIFLILAFCPKFIAIFLAVPDTIIGAMLLFTGVTVFMGGQEILQLKKLNNRMSLLVGFSFLLGLGFPLHPEYSASFPSWSQNITGSSYTVAALTGIFLNACFQIGIHKKLRFHIRPLQTKLVNVDKTIHDFMVKHHIPLEFVQSASITVKNTIQLLMKENLMQDDVLAVKLSFNSVVLKISLSYHGKALSTNIMTLHKMDSESEQNHHRAHWHKTHFKRGKTNLIYGFDIA